jgi:signal transduction histidine kinase/CheY-like chemotaxis protein
VRAIGRGFYDELGRPVHFDGVTVDITDHKRSAEQMRETQKLESLGILAGGVAHDFNNLLTGILGNASLALESMSPGHPNRPLLEEVTRASERAADLTRQLLAYAGKGRFVVRRVDVSDVVREISVLIQASIPKNVELRLDLQRHLPSIEADTSQMQQIVMNLIINGAEAVNEGEPGTVQVSTGVQQVNHHLLASWGGSGELAPGKYVYLEVRDTGRGMDAETQARIFDPFFTTKFMGRGLGLAAVSGIVRAHKGVIRVSSSPGKGSTFKVLLPACTGALPLDQPPSRRDLSGKGLILVVDDEEVVRRTARNALQRYGYSVLLAENGQDAIDLFRQMHDRISLVLLDLTMPRMSGELALRHLQAIKPDVKVLLSSGYNEVETVRRFTGKGLAGFIQKPYNAVALAEKIKQVL